MSDLKPSCCNSLFSWFCPGNHEAKLSCLRSHCEWNLEDWEAQAGPGAGRGPESAGVGAEELAPSSWWLLRFVLQFHERGIAGQWERLNAATSWLCDLEWSQS